MATEVQKGLAVVFGVAGATIEGYATVKTQGAKAAQNFEVTDLKDENGFTCTRIATDEYAEVDIEFTPTSTTRALAAAKFVFVAPLVKVALSGFAVAALNGDWANQSGATMDLSNGAPGKMTLKLRKYADATQNSALVAAAITG